MSLESNPATVQVTVVLNTHHEWHNWLFLRKNTADEEGLWSYCNPELSETEVLRLVKPIEPLISDYLEGATELGQLSTEDEKSYNWKYERWEKKYKEWE